MALNAFKALGVYIRNPTLAIPHFTVSSFGELPLPLTQCFKDSGNETDVRAVVLDKDNAFAAPHTNEVWPAYKVEIELQRCFSAVSPISKLTMYQDKFLALLKHYTPSRMLIVSNSSGLASKDRSARQATTLEENTGVDVLLHKERKPFCGTEVLQSFGGDLKSPSQLVVIGDNILTDVVMANMMGARSVWLCTGPKKPSMLSFAFSVASLSSARAKAEVENDAKNTARADQALSVLWTSVTRALRT
ncbi:MAG: hypothetical protein M1828_005449 [Chrysothrix sp. TS-e1954]|nr:MAG: hypothetical protein M1828_005449 [Chrysothrix sp. TS-e1954]